MKKTALVLGLALTAVAAPAQANEDNELRVEARAGMVFSGGADEAIAGVAAGYDFNLGEAKDGGGFIGVEASADKVLVGGADVLFGATARAGVNVGENGKLYGTLGYSFGGGDDAIHAGAGYQHKLGESLYLKGEYRHFFNDFADADVIAVGVGVAF